MLQAYWTELSAEEAYYWMYSQRPNWGYFDHPPMLALLINLGYGILPNELGVRLGSISCSALFIIGLYKLILPQNVGLFIATLTSIAILHGVGFLAVPDAPLLCFSVWFIWYY